MVSFILILSTRFVEAKVYGSCQNSRFQKQGVDNITNQNNKFVNV